MKQIITIKYCLDRWSGKADKGQRRSSKWPEVRKDYLAEYPFCAVCGGTKKLEVHHIYPFHLFPDLELDPKNFITLCESKKYGINCHLLIGHLGNYKKFNPSCQTDALVWHIKLKKE